MVTELYLARQNVGSSDIHVYELNVAHLEPNEIRRKIRNWKFPVSKSLKTPAGAAVIDVAPNVARAKLETIMRKFQTPEFNT